MLVVLVLGLPLFGGLALYLWVKMRLPDYNGRIQISGISQEIEILRDNYGMPHIYAADEPDLYFGFGYAVAQDRLVQMDLMRRFVAGELSEVLGAKLLDIDRFSRVVFKGGPKLADMIKQAPIEIAENYKAYAKGVNYFIENHPLPVEFTLMGYKPKPWNYADGFAVHYYMSWILNRAFFSELTCYLLIKKFGPEKAKGLCMNKTPILPNDPEIVGAKLKQLENKHTQSSLVSLLKTDVRAREFFQVSNKSGSNSWAIAGNKSQDGHPLLANDMHLSFSLPGVWYEAHLVTPEMNVSGVTVAGVPHIIVGGNTHVAWGFTNACADDTDFYIETIHPDKPDHYLEGKRFVKMRTVEEKIRVKGQESVSFTLRFTRHGPIINDVLDVGMTQGLKHKEVLAMRWTAYEHTRSSIALTELNHAKNADDIVKASRHFGSPAQNWVYADRDGNIGFTLAGCIPERRGFDGSLPVDGASGRYEWGPCVNLQPLQMRNPPRGWIASANEKHSSRFPHSISHYYEPPHRSMRISEFLDNDKKISKKDIQDMQNDTKILIFQEVKAVLEKIERKSLNDFEKKGLDTLLAWDSFARAKEEPAAAIFFALWSNLTENLFSKHLTEEERKLVFKNRHFLIDTLRTIFKEEENPWLDDSETQKIENREDVMLQGLKDALAFLQKKLGSDIADWEWGDIHRLKMEHGLGRVSPILGWFFNRGPFPVGGGIFSLSPMTFYFYKPYDAYIGDSMRYIIDLKDPDSSLRIIPAGISGNFLSPHYDDQIKKYLGGEYRPFVFSREKVLENQKYRLIFEPSSN